MSEDDKALVKRLRELERDLKPFEHKTVGSIRIDLDEVRAIIGCPDLIEAQAREIERLREALDAVLRESVAGACGDRLMYAGTVNRVEAALKDKQHGR